MAVSGPAGSGRVFGLTRDASVLFYEADVDGSRTLGFDEFLTILPKQMRSTATPEELRSLFNSADSNGNGVITLDELFLFTLAFLRWSDFHPRCLYRYYTNTPRVMPRPPHATDDHTEPSLPNIMCNNPLL